MPRKIQQPNDVRSYRDPPRHAKCVQILYTDGVEARWTEATIVERGKLILEDLPFAAGQAVEVLVLPGRAPSAGGQIKTLRDSVLEYREPFEPVADE